MNYDRQDLQVKDFLMVPKYFFSPEIIEKRKPLSNTARRAEWVGCNIILKQIPEEGRIFIVKNGIEIPQDEIILKVRKTEFIKQYKLDARGWVLDVLNCVNNFERICKEAWELLGQGRFKCENIVSPVVEFETCDQSYLHYVVENPAESVKMGVEFR